MYKANELELPAKDSSEKKNEKESSKWFTSKFSTLASEKWQSQQKQTKNFVI